jgi:hypothetical protein
MQWIEPSTVRDGIAARAVDRHADETIATSSCPSCTRRTRRGRCSTSRTCVASAYYVAEQFSRSLASTALVACYRSRLSEGAAMAKLRAKDVFTPGSFPTHTYVHRVDISVEQQLRDALETPGQLISLSGPSKSGKTVLVENVVGKDNLIELTGAGIKSGDALWERTLDWIGEPLQSSATETSSHKGAATVGVKGSAGIPLLAQGEVSGSGTLESGGQSTIGIVAGRRGLPHVIKEIANSPFVLLVDDFHYIDRDQQTEVAKHMKEAVRQGVKIVTASVTHRSDDVIRSLPDLRGRVTTIDLKYWHRDSLKKIATLGFEKLNVTLDDATLEVFATEASGSPQLMQATCLQACYELDIREQLDERRLVTVSAEQREKIFERTVATASYRTLVDILDAGPKTRGTERTIFNFKDGGEGDVYHTILRAIAADPPRQSFKYAEILKRVGDICVGASPVGSAITGSCIHMSRLAVDKQPEDRVIDWDEEKQVLDVPDPYLLFYLRWSGHII